jgi:hypothetical protein
MPFFSDASPGGFEPKRQFRFLASFTNLGDIKFMVTSAKKPSYEMSKPVEHQILNHVFKFPGIVKWTSPLEIKLIDAIEPDVGAKFYDLLLQTGYVEPTTESALLQGVTKVSTTSALGEVRIQQLDGGVDAIEGIPGAVNIVDEWTLKNAYVQKVTWGEQLDYKQEGLVEIGVSIAYDWASFKSGKEPVQI